MEAFGRVLRSGQFILGPEVEAFEEEVAAYLGVKHAIGVNSGTDALVISLRALGIGPGDEVITTPFTFFATAESISNVGATPVFVDIDPMTFNIDPALIEPAITERTRAIVPVHLFGQPSDMDADHAGGRAPWLAGRSRTSLRRWAGATRARSSGRSAMRGPSRSSRARTWEVSVTAALIATDDDGWRSWLRMLRAHGATRKYENEMIGYNSRLDEIQAAVLRVKLPRLDDANEGRRQVATWYDGQLASVEGIVPPTVSAGGEHVYHQYTIRVPGGGRDAVQAQLRGMGSAPRSTTRCLSSASGLCPPQLAGSPKR